MKRRIRIVDKSSGRSEEREFQIRDLSHFDSQLKFPHRIERPKKGKGSYVRKPKYKNSIY